MKLSVLILLMAASAAIAQSPAKPAAPAGTAAKPATAAATGIKLPPGVHPVKGVLKTAFSLRYQDFKLGAGPVAEPNKLYKVHYTGWRAADGVKFDSSYDHPGPPVMDKDGKPVMGEDGKPKHGDPQPMAFPQGMGRLIPGFDQGVAGMKVGGKRRLFIPWQLAYGTRNLPDRGPDHPGIPPKSDLIFDVELVEVSDLPAPPPRPGMPGRPLPGGNVPRPGGAPPQPGSPTTPAPGTPAPAALAPGAAAPAKVPATPPPPAATPGAPTPQAAPAPAQPSTPPQPSTTAQPSTPPQPH
jgi:peptidylprolyl isomerase